MTLIEKIVALGMQGFSVEFKPSINDGLEVTLKECRTNKYVNAIITYEYLLMPDNGYIGGFIFFALDEMVLKIKELKNDGYCHKAYIQIP